MQIIPAIDLKDNKCVRLSKGKDDSSVVFNNNPESQAVYFEKIGCKKLHIVDIDAAFGRPDINFKSIKKIRDQTTIPIQLGGGIRTFETAEAYFDLGIDNLIIGSLSVKKPEIVNLLSEKFKNKIYISLDIYENNVMVKGWNEKSSISIDNLLELYSEKNIRGYVATDIQNDGMLKGLNIDFVKNIMNKIKRSKNFIKKVIFAGGLTNFDDIRRLKLFKSNNLEGIISGKSFYVKNLDLRKAQKLLDSND